jgi:DNA-binding XRE family transcriptional regulator
MLAHMKMQTTGELAEIIVTVPIKDALKIREAVSAALNTAGHRVRDLNDEGNEVFSVAEVFPERAPGMLIEGFRLKFDLTQEKLAELLGTKQNRVSDLENGRREVSKEMAKKLGAVFKVPYQMFL